MDYTKLAKQHLQDAIEKGQITLFDADGMREIKLRASEILTVCKFVIKEGLLEGQTEQDQSTMPTEMLRSPDVLKYHTNEYERDEDEDYLHA